MMDFDSITFALMTFPIISIIVLAIRAPAPVRQYVCTLATDIIFVSLAYFIIAVLLIWGGVWHTQSSGLDLVETTLFGVAILTLSLRERLLAWLPVNRIDRDAAQGIVKSIVKNSLISAGFGLLFIVDVLWPNSKPPFMISQFSGIAGLWIILIEAAGQFGWRMVDNSGYETIMNVRPIA